jgi:acetylglutamate kinase
MKTEKITVVKLGGNIINDENSLNNFLFSFSSLKGKKILVHGGGKIATEISLKLGIETQMLNGRRVTDERSIDVITMVYAGLLNKKIVVKLQQYGCDAIGLCGADGNLIPAQKRSVIPVDYGFVGDPVSENINVALLNSLLGNNFSPVIAPVTHESGTLLNTNADTIASVLACALAKENEVQLIYCFEKNGVLLDSDDDESLISSLSKDHLQQLINEGKIHSGMLPKINAALNAQKNGVQRVVIGNAKQLTALADGSPACTTLH